MKRSKPDESAVANEVLLARARVTVEALGPKLNQAQQKVVALVERGEGVFFTGCAGSGKSLLLQFLIAKLRLRPGGIQTVGVTATTGVAAINIGGITLHKWSGIGLGDKSKEALLSNLKRDEAACAVWRRARTLVIDEISMLSGELFRKLSWIASNVRRDGRPFGGLQLIVAGDFLQLPPVVVTEGYVFETQEWKDLFPPSQCVVLRQIYRQTDARYLEILNHIRMGLATQQMLDELNEACVRPFSTRDGIISTKMFCTNANVDMLNAQELQKVSSA